MTNRRTLLGLTATVLICGAPGLPRDAVAEPGDARAQAFIKRTGERLIAVINGPGNEQQKRAELTSIIDSAVDVGSVARFCLARYWRTASPDEQRQYTEAFHAMLVHNIAGKLGDYQGVRFTVGHVQQRDDAELVATTVERPNNQPSRIEWMVTDVAGTPKIEDMIAEGVSLRLTARSDYEAFLARNGNNVRTLIQSLRQKVAANG